MAAAIRTERKDGILIVSHDIDEIFPQGPERPTAVVSPLPLVTVDWPLCRGYCVLVDLENVGYQGCRHLLEHGHRRIGLITFAGEAANVLPIEAGYRRALEEAGHVADAGLVEIQWRRAVR